MPTSISGGWKDFSTNGDGPKREPLQTPRRVEELGYGRAVARLLQLPEVNEEEARDEYRHRFLSLALEAFRLSEISRSKLSELGNMIGLADTELAELLGSIGWESAGEQADVLVPPE
jgi:hypothetical protein